MGAIPVSDFNSPAKLFTAGSFQTSRDPYIEVDGSGRSLPLDVALEQCCVQVSRPHGHSYHLSLCRACHQHVTWTVLGWKEVSVLWCNGCIYV